MRYPHLRLMVVISVLISSFLISTFYSDQVEAAAFPEQGKTISVIVGFAPGSSTDISARLLAAPLEKELGVPVQINRISGIF